LIGVDSRLIAMPIKDRYINPPLEQPGGEGWLVNSQQLVCQFRPDAPSAHGQ